MSEWKTKLHMASGTYVSLVEVDEHVLGLEEKIEELEKKLSLEYPDFLLFYHGGKEFLEVQQERFSTNRMAQSLNLIERIWLLDQVEELWIHINRNPEDLSVAIADSAFILFRGDNFSYPSMKALLRLANEADNTICLNLAERGEMLRQLKVKETYSAHDNTIIVARWEE